MIHYIYGPGYKEERIPLTTPVATFIRIRAENEKGGWRLTKCVPVPGDLRKPDEIILGFSRMQGTMAGGRTT